MPEKCDIMTQPSCCWLILYLSGLPMKTGGGAGDSPPSAAVAHSDEFCKMSAGSVPPGKLAHTSQNCPRPPTAT